MGGSSGRVAEPCWLSNWVIGPRTVPILGVASKPVKQANQDLDLADSPRVVDIRLAFVSLSMALAVAAWAYGVYCYVQMVRHRRPGVSSFTLMWPRERLTDAGLEYRRRALWSYVAVVALLVSVALLARLPGGT